jgi:hypothetical protein
MGNLAVPRADRYRSVIRKWMTDYRANHASCNAGPSITPLPTRVIDVGDGADSPIRINLSTGTAGQYFALNHY